MAVLFVMRKYFSASAAGNRHFHFTLSSISVSGDWRVVPRHIFSRRQKTPVTLHACMGLIHLCGVRDGIIDNLQDGV